MPSPQADTGALFLVTDLGLRDPLANDAVLGMLGYGSSTPVNLPATVVARLPEGPSLNPELASAPVTPL